MAFTGTNLAPEIQHQLNKIPMIFNIVADPVGNGIVKNYAPTGRNFTGVSHMVPLEVQAIIINDLQIKHVALIFNPAEPNSVSTVQQLDKCLLSHQLTTTKFPINSLQIDTLESKYWNNLAIKLQQDKVDLVYLPSDSLVISHAHDITMAMHQLKLPTFSATEEPIHKGALMGVVSHYAAAGYHAALMAERILRYKVSAGTIPISTPYSYLFVINETSMRNLEYYPPVQLLQYAEFTK
ncbi:hypothetical protein TI04_09795 [Achromatium sp. WMS2]|nr:hypothetical protein TI04_09795 [Achromatium sp. WMS2]